MWKKADAKIKALLEIFKDNKVKLLEKKYFQTTLKYYISVSLNCLKIVIILPYIQF